MPRWSFRSPIDGVETADGIPADEQAIGKSAHFVAAPPLAGGDSVSVGGFPIGLCGLHCVEKPSGSANLGIVDHETEVGWWFVAAHTKNGENRPVILVGGQEHSWRPSRGAGWMLTINSWRLLGLIFTQGLMQQVWVLTCNSSGLSIPQFV